MTIKKLSEELGVSPQAIYQKLKKSKVDVRKLVDYQTRELSADGEYTIRKLFSHDASEPKQTKQSIIDEYVKPYNIPVCYDFPTGHDESWNYPLIEGCPVTLDVAKDKVTMEFNLPK